MFDMFKAFDTIQRGTLSEDLKEILESYAIHLIHLLLNDIGIAVKLKNKTGELFKSLIGSQNQHKGRKIISIESAIEIAQTINILITYMD